MLKVATRLLIMALIFAHVVHAADSDSDSDFDNPIASIVNDCRESDDPTLTDFANKADAAWAHAQQYAFDLHRKAFKAAKDAEHKAAWGWVDKLGNNVAEGENPDEVFSREWDEHATIMREDIEAQAMQAAREVFQKEAPKMNAYDVEQTLNRLLCDRCSRAALSCERHGKIVDVHALMRGDDDDH